MENHQPYHWYKDLVVLGAKYLKFPDSYISTIDSVESKEDPDKTRKAENDILIKRIKGLPKAIFTGKTTLLDIMAIHLYVSTNNALCYLWIGIFTGYGGGKRLHLSPLFQKTYPCL